MLQHSLEGLRINGISVLEKVDDLEIEGWLEVLDLRTKETNEHILRVTAATVILAQMAGVPEADIPCIKHGALLHDIRKIGIPDTILLKSCISQGMTSKKDHEPHSRTGWASF